MPFPRSARIRSLFFVVILGFTMFASQVDAFQYDLQFVLKPSGLLRIQGTNFDDRVNPFVREVVCQNNLIEWELVIDHVCTDGAAVTYNRYFYALNEVSKIRCYLGDGNDEWESYWNNAGVGVTFGITAYTPDSHIPVAFLPLFDIQPDFDLTVFGDVGHDDLRTRNNKSTLFGKAGNDVVVTDGDFNFLRGNNGSDVLYSAGNEGVLDGGGGIDIVYCYGGNSLAFGGSGHDYLISSATTWNCQLSGDRGNDLFLLRGNLAAVDGGEGLDAYVVPKPIPVVLPPVDPGPIESVPPGFYESPGYQWRAIVDFFVAGGTETLLFDPDFWF